MNLSFKNRKLKNSLTIDKEIIKSYGTMAKKVKQRMIALEEADNLTTISKIPAMRLHPYKGDRIGEWSIDIFKNWRICFELDYKLIPEKEDGGVNLDFVTAIKIISVEDPH